MKLTLVFECKVKTCPSIFLVEEKPPAEPVQRDLVLALVVAVVTLGSADDICSEQQQHTTAGPARPASTHTHTPADRAVSCK